MSISSILDLPWTHAYWTEGPEFVAAAPAGSGGSRVGPMSLNLAADPQITLWPDEVSTADASTAAGTTGQPWYSPSSATFGGKPVVYIPASDNNDRRLTASFSTLSQPFDIVIIGRFTDTLGRNFLDNNSVFRMRIGAGTSGGADTTAEYRIDFGINTVGLEGTLADTSVHLFRARADTTDHLFVDEAENITGDAGGNSLTGLTLLNTYSGSGPFNGEVAFIGIAATPLTQAQIEDLQQWAHTHYGTTLGTVPPAPYGVATFSKFWVKADAITGLSDGDPVSQWDDSSGFSKHATATGSLRPVYKTGILNGHPVVRFDGTDDVLATSGVPTAVTDNWTMILVVDPNTNGSNGCAPMCNGSGSNGYAIATRGNTGAFKSFLNAGINWHDTATASDTNPGVWILQRLSGTESLYVDGGSALGTSAQAPSTPGTKLTLGFTSGSPSAYLNGDIAEAILFDVALSKADLNTLGAALASKWGTTWTTIP